MTNTNIYTRLNNLVCALRADEDNCDLVETVRDTVDSCRNYVGMGRPHGSEHPNGSRDHGC